ncbi:helicase with zinc finger domain 2 [Chanos chanos]|uniref:Helicase with zinc finger domain 2 n=1 Tax=Chanos chanos TaxID=29144 RepID=A0A6J2UL23_CHACN|nr:helicase with zinc finger domain 2-like [Chanos chanos]
MKNSELEGSSEESDSDDNISKSLSNLILKRVKPVNRPSTWEFEFDQDLSQGQLQHLLDTNPQKFKHCKLVMQSFDLAYAKPLSDPAFHISVRGRQNMGRSFPGDEVCIEIFQDEECPLKKDILSGKVVGVIKRDERHSMFLCKMVGQSPQIVTPINKCMPRIRTIQTEPDRIEVREEEHGRWIQKEFEEIRNNQLLAVKILKWKQHCHYPLGVVTKVFTSDIETSHEWLDFEYDLTDEPPSYKAEQPKQDDVKRDDLRKYITFTIDPPEAEDLDDAISVTDMGGTYEIAIHITDVASYVTKDSEEDKFARQRGETFYRPKSEPAYMFSRDLSSNHLSLLPGKDRNAISLLTIIEKKNNMMISKRFTLSLIRSDKRMSLEEADMVIQEYCLNSERPLKFSTVEECLVVAYRFSEIHRRSRLDGKWGAGQQIRQSRSHCMVEELMNFYNSAVAEYLISSDLTRDLTPLRCQSQPDPEQLQQFKERHSALIPLSIRLSHLYDESEERKNDKQDDKKHAHMPFVISTTVLERMESCARSRDHYTLMKLIASDEIHPTLWLMSKEFQHIQGKAVILRSCSTPVSKLGHYSLQLDSYTWASSPMRRYLDLILQRLLHLVLCEKKSEEDGYKQSEINQFCESGMEQFDRVNEYNLQVWNLTTGIKHGILTKLAVVDKIYPNRHDFKISFPQKSVSRELSIMYRHLKLAEQPHYNDEEHSVTLCWKRRIYSFKVSGKTVIPKWSSKNVTFVSTDTWKQMISATEKNDWYEIEKCLEDMKACTKKNVKELKDIQQEHFKELKPKLKVGDVLEVQLSAEGHLGQLSVQLLNISPEFEVCLEHTRNPTKCFSEAVPQPTKKYYHDCREYQMIWRQLCQMDTAHNAVEENNSIILEDVRIEWTNKGNLKGSFKITQTLKKQWSLEFDLMKCFLCIRLRDQNMEQESEDSTDERGLENSDLQDSVPFTWVAHGVTIKPKKEKMDEDAKKSPNLMHIKFKICQRPMEYIPSMIFKKDTVFTVEVIPKKIPYLLREQAVANLKRANHLVKSIATGELNVVKSDEKDPEHFVEDEVQNENVGPLTLNKSQKEAVEEALKNPFTLIQGPPGTNRNIVGVHLVYQFYLKNRLFENLRSEEGGLGQNTTSKEKPKKCGILYCGPSNKSVDIVAEQLMKLKGDLKPLRVYCEQMEMREFPYPGSDMKLCRRTFRDKPKKELRSITLMYLIRKPENSLSNKIKDFENKFKGEEYNDGDIESYRALLKEAREEEMRKHNVILCTCSLALNPSFIKTMDFRQILIDECAMATEPEALIPLVSHNPEKIVLLGDHKQIRPIVECAPVKRLGMQESLFERYMDKALMLDTQYRMHEGICEFPSVEFYDGKLMTHKRRRPCLLLKQNKDPTPILFGHVQGEEVSLIVSTTEGNENSTANPEEAKQAVRIAGLLIKHSVPPESIAILTPYNAQVSKINQTLKAEGIENVNVCTIMKSQGSEWPYVILSTVRSCSQDELGIQLNPSKGWLGKRLGFITDRNQVNVAITRAQDGLCILGNRHLLRFSELWGKLLKHYEKHDCVVDPAKNIQVQNPITEQE